MDREGDQEEIGCDSILVLGVQQGIRFRICDRVSGSHRDGNHPLEAEHQNEGQSCDAVSRWVFDIRISGSEAIIRIGEEVDESCGKQYAAGKTVALGDHTSVAAAVHKPGGKDASDADSRNQRRRKQNHKVSGRFR